MVHQHFQLIPVFTVVENVVLGNELAQGPAARPRRGPRRASASSARSTGSQVDPDALVGDLSVGEQQRVELIKALYRDADILILDEPTAVLTPGEVDEFFGVVRSLVDQGKSIIFITHKLREVLAVADRIVVLRGGRGGRRRPTRTSATQQSLATLMVGRDVSFTIDKAPAAARRRRCCAVRDLERRRRPRRHAPSPASTSRCAPARSSASPASRATASASWSRRSWACGPSAAGSVEIAGHDVTARHAPRDHRARRGPRARGPQQARPGRRRSRSPTTSCSTATGTGPFSRRGLRNDGAIARARRASWSSEFDVRTPEHRTCRSDTSRAATSRR